MPFVKRQRTYYKYDWKDYSLPEMTSNTTPEGKLTYDIGIGGPYATDIYPVFFGGSSININGLYNQATRYLRYIFAKILKAGKYTFTYAAYRQNNVTNNLNKWEAILDDDSRVEIMNPTITTSTQTFTAEFEVDKPIKAINLTLYASAPSESSCYYGIDKIALTGEGLAENTVKAAEIVAGTESDHDYYVDSNKLYQLATVKRSYWKYVWEDWTQPVLTANGTVGGKSFAVRASNTDSRTQPYYAFDSNKGNHYSAGWLSKASNNYLEWYNPEGLNISQLKIQYQTYPYDSVGYVSSWEIKVSNDGTNYTSLLKGTEGNYGITTIPIEHSGLYKYWRFYVYAWSSEWYDILDMQITAQKQIVVEGTSTDYDYYTDKLLSYEPYAPKFERYSETFTASSDIQPFTVPEGITKLNIVCAASKGYGSTGGGGKVICDLAVTEGQNLYIVVGGIPNGYATSSYNASDIRLDNTGITDTTSLQSRIIVAGGAGNQASRGAAGGAGGGLTGANGGTGYGGDSQGKGGTQTAGGAGGAGTPVSVGHYHNGEDGTFGLGGAGNIDDSYEGRSGAGGAGYYGGGSGASDWNKNGAYTAGGGGGSSYTDDTLCSNVTHLQGSNNGDGYVTIKYVKELIK